MTSRRLKTTLRERTLIQSDLIARLRRGPARALSELTCVGTPKQTEHELRELEVHRLVRFDLARQVWVYLGFDQRIPPGPASFSRPGSEASWPRLFTDTPPQPIGLIPPSADLSRPMKTSADLPQTSRRRTKYQS